MNYSFICAPLLFALFSCDLFSFVRARYLFSLTHYFFVVVVRYPCSHYRVKLFSFVSVTFFRSSLTLFLCDIPDHAISRCSQSFSRAIFSSACALIKRRSRSRPCNTFVRAIATYPRLRHHTIFPFVLTRYLNVICTKVEKLCSRVITHTMHSEHLILCLCHHDLTLRCCHEHPALCRCRENLQLCDTHTFALTWTNVCTLYHTVACSNDCSLE